MSAPLGMAPRDRFSSRVTLSEREISDFALAAGDTNPLHHDRAHANASRYGGVIASGPQTSSLLMGLVASHYSQIGPMVGLEFAFYFRTAVPARDLLTLEWMVIRVSETRSGSRVLVDLRGRLRTSTGVTSVGAKGRVLVDKRLAERPAA